MSVTTLNRVVSKIELLHGYYKWLSCVVMIDMMQLCRKLHTPDLTKNEIPHDLMTITNSQWNAFYSTTSLRGCTTPIAKWLTWRSFSSLFNWIFLRRLSVASLFRLLTSSSRSVGDKQSTPNYILLLEAINQ